ncbi:MAG: hypothetical protein IKA99_02340, partial [Clostridia bacterium]|nr:hypothetical protein [Clostridia bacterium]
MIKLKAKFMSAIMAFCCVFACLGVGTALISNKATEAKAATTTHNLGALTFHANSQPWGAAGTWNHRLYLVSENGVGLPVNSWDEVFEADEDGYFKINDEVKTPKIRSADGCFFFEFDALNAGDVVTIGGSFKCESQGVIYNTSESEFQWNGGAWQQYVPVDQYNNHKLGTVVSISNDASAVYLAFAEGVTLPVSSWDYAFNEITGNGITVDGTMVRNYNNIKSVGDKLYVELANVSEGSTLVIEGGFGNISQGHRYVVEESKFVWNGSAWVASVTERNLGALILHGNSNVGGASGLNNVLYLMETDGSALPIENWNYLFTADSPENFKINGQSANFIAKSTDAGFYWEFEALDPNDVITISGTFLCDALHIRYSVEESSFMWNGTRWEVVEYVPPVEYATYTVTKISGYSPKDEQGNVVSNNLYLYTLEGDTLPKEEGDWDARYTFVEGSGDGLSIGGVTFTTTDIKLPGDFFINLGEAPNVGDVFTIDGTYVNEAKAHKFVFVNCQLQWNGSAWVEYVPYTVHNIGALDFHANVNAGGNGVIYLKRADNKALPVLDWEAPFLAESAENFKINGVAADLIKIRSTGDGFYWEFKTLNAGDYITISGTFVCESQLVKYVIEESKFTWNGSAWENYVDYETYELGGVVAIADGAANNGYLQFADGVTLPVNSWDYAFMLFSGDGITVDGNPIDMTNNVKSVGNKLYVTLKPTPASENSILSIGGTFYNEELGVKYVVDESKFVWNGSAWENYVEYTSHEIGTLVLHGNSITGGAKGNNYELYLQRVDGGALPVMTWQELFISENANNFKINDTNATLSEMKSTDAGLYLKFGALTAGDVVTISGTFRNANLAVKYVIVESKFRWTGTGWEIPYTTTELGTLKVSASTAAYIRVAPSNGTSISSTRNKTFVNVSGTGIKVGDNTFTKLEQPHRSYFQINFDSTPEEGATMTIGGEFVYSVTKYVITDTTFVFENGSWTIYDPYKDSTYNIGKVVIGANSGAGAVYFDKASGEAYEVTDGTWAEKLTFLAGSGVGVTINGTQINMNDIKIPNNIYVGSLPTGINKGDVLTIGGAFYNANLVVKYVIEESTFFWTGAAWIDVMYKDEDLATYDVVNLSDLGLGVTLDIPGGVEVNRINSFYNQSVENVTGSKKFRFGYTSTNSNAGAIDIRLRCVAGDAGAWDDSAKFSIAWSAIFCQGSSYPLASNTYYVIELGAIDLKDGSGTWLYVAVDDIIVISKVVVLDDTRNTNRVSICATAETEKSTITDCDNVAVTYVSTSGTFVDYAKKNEAYSLVSNRAYNTFIGWAVGNTLYKEGDEITVSENITVNAVEVDFAMKDGAAIRLSSVAS